MSGHRQKVDPDLCWNCGKPGAVLGFVSDRRNCPDCEVTWAPEWSATRGDLNYVCWMGTVIFCVDFTSQNRLERQREGRPLFTPRRSRP